MSDYSGQVVRIPVGSLGLMTDLPQGTLPSATLLRAMNAHFENSYPEKCPGSRKWNETALATGILQFSDWWPNSTTQRVIAIGANGKTYRFKDAYVSAELTPSGSAPTTLNVSEYLSMVVGGQESEGDDRKLFMFTGNDPVQVLVADGLVRRNLTSPAADWATSPPLGGIIYRNALFAFAGHRVYRSLETNHEDFTSSGTSQYAVFPGDGEFVVNAFIYKTKLFVSKYPTGVFYLVDTDDDPDNWYFTKVQPNVGGISPNGVCPGGDDIFMMSEFASLISLTAAFQLGDIQSSDIFTLLKNKNFVDEEISTSNHHRVQGVYYKDKQQLVFCMAARASSSNDRVLVVSLKEAKSPKISWYDKDQANCLALVKDSNRIERPLYGANDGFLYQMDMPDRWVGSASDSETASAGYLFDIETPHIDFREINPLWAEQAKNFDWLEVIFIPTGNWDLSVDVFIDGAFHRTLQYSMNGNNPLGNFYLDQSRLESGAERVIQKQLGGRGKTIAFRCYNSGTGENIKLVALRVGLQVTGTDQKQVKR